MTRPDSWFRMYNHTLDNPKAQRLSGDLFKAWINLLCLASKSGGRLPCNADVAFALRMDETSAETLQVTLRERGLLDWEKGVYFPHDWADLQFKSDTSTERVKQYRERKKKLGGNVSSNEPVTVQEEIRTEQSRAEKKEDFSFREIVRGLSQPKNQKTWTPEQKKAAWQSGICNWAQKSMGQTEYAAFLEAWTTDEPWARRRAEEIDGEIKAARLRKECGDTRPPIPEPMRRQSHVV